MVDRNDQFERAMAERRAVLGDAYVDAAMSDTTSGTRDFQDFVTSTAWQAWTRGVLARRDRCLIVLSVAVSLNRMEEFRLHLCGARRIGISDAEIDELVVQIAAYAGAPAGVSARRVVKAFRAEEGAGSL